MLTLKAALLAHELVVVAHHDQSEICHGKPVIRNLRYPVESLLEYLAGSDAIEEVLAEFPDLEREDLLACLELAQRSSS